MVVKGKEKESTLPDGIAELIANADDL